jgi:hypothetical protein
MSIEHENQGPVTYYVPPYEGQSFPDVLDSRAIAPNTPHDQEFQAQELLSYFAKKEADDPAYTGYSEISVQILGELDRLIGDGEIDNETPADTLNNSRGAVFPLQAGWTQKAIEAYDNLDVHYAEDKRAKYRHSDPLHVYGELPLAARDLMEKTHLLLGAKLLRDDFENGNKDGLRMWIGQWKGIRLRIGEQRDPDLLSDDESIMWWAQNYEWGTSLTELSNKDRGFLRAIGVELEKRPDLETIDRTNIGEIAELYGTNQ